MKNTNIAEHADKIRHQSLNYIAVYGTILLLYLAARLVVKAEDKVMWEFVMGRCKKRVETHRKAPPLVFGPSFNHFLIIRT